MRSFFLRNKKKEQSEKNTETKEEQAKNTEAIRLAKQWAGRRVTISGVGGTIHVDPEDTSKVKTTHGKASMIAIERAPEALKMPGAIAFRIEGTQKYLTSNIYGDSHRQDAAEVLAAIPNLLPEHICEIVDYAIGRPTGETNFEGAGFNYSPMTAQEGPPNKLQLFELENLLPDRRNKFGVKSLFGTYWRSQHWDKVVSQSPHRLGDETWYFSHQVRQQNRLERDW